MKNISRKVHCFHLVSFPYQFRHVVECYFDVYWNFSSHFSASMTSLYILLSRVNYYFLGIKIAFRDTKVTSTRRLTSFVKIRLKDFHMNLLLVIAIPSCDPINWISPNIVNFTFQVIEQFCDIKWILNRFMANPKYCHGYKSSEILNF